jgi:hypothetical protein
MAEKRWTTREKLEYMKQIEARNELRRKQFAEKKARDERLFYLYETGRINKEEFLKLFKR